MSITTLPVGIRIPDTQLLVSSSCFRNPVVWLVACASGGVDLAQQLREAAELALAEQRIDLGEPGLGGGDRVGQLVDAGPRVDRERAQLRERLR